MSDFISRSPDFSTVVQAMQGVGLGISISSQDSVRAMEKTLRGLEAMSQDDDVADDTQFFSMVLDDDDDVEDAAPHPNPVSLAGDIVPSTSSLSPPAPDAPDAPDAPTSPASSTSSGWSRHTFASASPSSSITSFHSLSDDDDDGGDDDEDDEALEEWLRNASVIDFFNFFSAEDYADMPHQIIDYAAEVFDEIDFRYFIDLLRAYGVDVPVLAPPSPGAVQAPRVTVITMPQYGFAFARDWSRVTEAVGRGEYVVIVPEGTVLVADLESRVANAISGMPSMVEDTEGEGEDGGERRGMKRKAMDDGEDDEDIKPTILGNGEVATASPVAGPSRAFKRLKTSHSLGSFDSPSTSGSGPLMQDVRPRAPPPSRIPRYRALQSARPAVRFPSAEAQVKIEPEDNDKLPEYIRVKIESPPSRIPPSPVSTLASIATGSMKRRRESDSFEGELEEERAAKKMKTSPIPSHIPRLVANMK